MRCRTIGSLLGMLLGVLGGVLLIGGQAAAHCTFQLDRAWTTPGGEFRGIGDPFLVGEKVTIRWMPTNIVLDEFVVTASKDGYGYFNRLLQAPQGIEPGPYIVSADVQPQWGQPYRLSRPLEVRDPSAPPPAGGSDERDQAPPPPTQAHQPVRYQQAPEPVRAPEPARAPAPAHAAVRAPVPAHAPATAPVTAEAPQTAKAPAPESIPAGVWVPGALPDAGPEAAPIAVPGTLERLAHRATGPVPAALLLAFVAVFVLGRRRTATRLA